MFETEAGFAETKMLINCNGDYSKKQDYKKGWQDGATFGYNKAKEEGKVVVEHFEAYGQCRDSRRIAGLEKENEELKAQIEEMKCWHKMDYNDKESCKKIPQGIQLLTEYDCGLFVAYCVNRWTGDHWEEHRYGITRWKEIKENDRN